MPVSAKEQSPSHVSMCFAGENPLSPLEVQSRLFCFACFPLQRCFILQPSKEGRKKKNSSTFLWFPKGHNRFLISLLLDLSRNGALSKAVPAGKEQQGALETSPAPVRSRGAGGGGAGCQTCPAGLCWQRHSSVHHDEPADWAFWLKLHFTEGIKALFKLPGWAEWIHNSS